MVAASRKRIPHSDLETVVRPFWREIADATVRLEVVDPVPGLGRPHAFECGREPLSYMLTETVGYSCAEHQLYYCEPLPDGFEDWIEQQLELPHLTQVGELTFTTIANGKRLSVTRTLVVFKTEESAFVRASAPFP